MKRKGSPAGVAVSISGGLGNQMFQYAAGRSLALRLGVPLRLDTSFYRDGRHRAFELDRLPVSAEISGMTGAGLLRRLIERMGGGRNGGRYREPHFHYDSAFERLTAPVRLDGYFQSPKYFESEAPAIRAELMPPPPADTESRELEALMTVTPAASLHIRRGDYVTSSKAQAIYAACTLGYYEAAIRLLPGDGPVVVFSDDIAWARQNLKAERPLVFAGEKGPRSGLADLWLMTRATHHIIANSSFSWWGAFLAGEDTGVTIAPGKWFNDPAIDDRDLFPANWKRLPLNT